MKVALVHDDLIQWGGAERVLVGLCAIYPDAPIYTSVCDFDNLTLKRNFVNEGNLLPFGNKKIITSFLQKIPGWKSLYKALLPLYPIAFEQFVFDEYDLVISHTTRFAKSIITKPKTKHICYCHTPPRFLWHFSGEKAYGIGELLMSKLRIYDQVSARRVDHFIAGSQNAQKRIKKIYAQDCELVYPFIDLERFRGIDTFDGGYFVVVARPNKYKRVDLAKNACKKIGVELKVVSGGMDDRMVMAVLAGCRALIVPGIEDFGLVSLEAQALGKPVVAYRAGGALETVKEEITGLFFDQQTGDSLKEALIKLNYKKFKPEDCQDNARSFGKDKFIKNFKQAIASL